MGYSRPGDGVAAAVALVAPSYLNYRRSRRFRNRVIGIILARFASSRFQGKPLVHILGKPMIQRRWERAKMASSLLWQRTMIKLQNVVEDLTSESCCNGTERCNEAHQKLGNKYDIIVNIQGDEPLIEPEIIDGIVKALPDAPDAVFNTAVTSLKPEDAFDPNRVKCVVDNRVVESFDSKFPEIYPQLPPTPLQLEEDLEQLKVLENGYKMKVIKVDHDAHGVDTQEDVEKIERYMQEKNLA